MVTTRGHIGSREGRAMPAVPEFYNAALGVRASQQAIKPSGPFSPHVAHEKPMPNEALAQFANQRYLNLESFKGDGTSVQTPVWFAEDNGVLYIYMLAPAS